ncbi:MAG: preprotein translocase subunit SecY [Planctomycetaceae bacterium]|nr:preprotein translocase subunit SecY [Planctomycetaceae bacterium]
MFAKFATIFKIPELRRKIFLTLFLLFVYRLGFYITLPNINQSVMKDSFESMKEQNSALGNTLKMVELFSASNFGNSTIFGLGIMPYISASIILQLLGSVYPPLEKLQKEGEAGRKKINEYTRYLTVVLCFFQSLMWIRFLAAEIDKPIIYAEWAGFWPTFFAAWTMTAGTVFLMWIGEQIDEYGIGNGISLLIMAGILARIPNAIQALSKDFFLNEGVHIGGDRGIERLLILAALFLAVIVAVIVITQGQRRIPTQSAKHVRGRRVWGGQRQYLPLRVNQAGVMPIIFASSLLMFPNLLFQWIHGTEWGRERWVITQLSNSFGGEKGYIYNVCYIALIYFFCYFWTAITFNPKDMANNLKDYGSFIPGHRPGRRTADYLERVMVRITYVGAAFLALVAVIPTVVQNFLNIDFVIASFFGGTGLLIVVSVALDLVQKIDSHLVMRNYGGLLES